MNELIRSLSEEIFDSFAQLGAINHIGALQLPSKQAVRNITKQLLHLMFPGFYDGDPLAGKPLNKAIQEQVTEIYAILVPEIRKAVAFHSPECGEEKDAEKIVQSFIVRLASIRQILSTDVEAAYDSDPAAASLEEIILSYPGIEAIAIHRLSHELHRLGVPLIPRMMAEWAHSHTGIDIHPGATIGSHFFIDHGTSVVIGETCEIGHHVKIYHGVTLGARSTYPAEKLRGKKRHPTIQDHVTIYPGTTILGGETVIGEGSVIGGNVFLMESIPPGQLVMGEDRGVIVRPKVL